jgi:transposase-like protein
MARKRRTYTPEFQAEAFKLVELRRLRAENRRLLAERDILKKAPALFAREAT